ncbi:ATP-binding protein [Leptothoe sp. EHU-05/26/07-4]
MSSWAEQNRAYLLAVCRGLRLRLRRAIGEDAITPEMLEEAEVAIAKAAAMDPEPAALELGYRFNLTDLDLGILLLCVAMEVDPQIPELCDQAQGDRGWAFPTFALCFNLFDQVQWDVMTVDAPLRYWRLVELHSPQPQPLPQTMLRADERVVNHVMGSSGLDHRLEGLVTPLGRGAVRLSASQRAVVESLGERLAGTERGQVLPVVQLLGHSEPTKVLVARAVARGFGMGLYCLMGELIPTGDTAFTEFLRLWERETFLSAVALYVDTQELGSDSSGRVALRRFLSGCDGLVFVDSREVRLPTHRVGIVQEVGKPTAMEQREVWEDMLGEGSDEMAGVLAGQFCLNVSEIEEISNEYRVTSNKLGEEIKTTLREEHSSTKIKIQKEEETVQNSKFKIQNSDTPSPHHPITPSPLLWNACLNRTRPRLESLAQRVDVKATWDQLVLPDEAMGILRQIVDQVRLRSRVYDDWGFRERMNRGFGVSAMFAGPSGTGKTMAAEVIANELGLHLYRIDLSSVVSKYIGETEKNLRRLFDAAEEGGAILFFDEADALFGKRSEVKDSHDRYANVEINYLLQRIEAFRGLAVLATNLRGALDDAFLRRLRFLVEFPFPSREYREILWRKVFPVGCVSEEMDYGELGGFDVAGGTIQTVALNAAFVAAERGELVGMGDVLGAMRVEYGKLGRVVYASEFQWQDVEHRSTDWEQTQEQELADD